MGITPLVGISACLLGRRVRYDGGDRLDSLLVEELGRFVRWVPVCPEVEFGLPVPREPIQLTGDPRSPGLETITTCREFGEAMRSFCRRRAAELNVSGFIFKSRSPSCGLRAKVHGSPGGEAPGFFAAALRERRPELPVAESDSLLTAAEREIFLGLLRGR